MINGRLSERILKRSVLRQFHNESESIDIKSAGVGNDCAFIYAGNDIELGVSEHTGVEERQRKADGIAVNTQAVCFGGEKAGYYAVMQAVNNIAASGAEPEAVSDAIIMPKDSEEQELQSYIRPIRKACDEIGIPVICGHTEISPYVNNTVVTVTALGRTSRRDADVTADRSLMRPGQDIVMSKYIGLEGTAVLSSIFREKLRERLPAKLIDEASGYGSMISVLPEAAGAIKSGVCAMHDVSQGGIFGALWEMAEAAGTGLEIDLKAIPVRQETIEICEQLGLNPYRLLSGGALLMAADNGEQLAESLKQSGIPAQVIGRATDGNDRVLIGEDNGERRFLEPVNPEELFRVL